MKLVLKDTEKIITVSESIFNFSFNKYLVHQVVTAYQAKRRQGTRAQKNRSEIVGSNKKPWRQKGTGRARAGSVKSPIWRSGGVTFAAKPKKYTQKVNKKMYKNALKSIFSELLRQKRLLIVEKFFLEIPKTKFLLEKLKNINFKNILIINDKFEKNLFLASRNLNKVHTNCIKNIDLITLISCNKIIITEPAIKKIEALLK